MNEPEDGSQVLIATDDDLRAAVANTLKGLGVSWEELASKADDCGCCGDFTPAEERAWFFLQDMREYAEVGA